VKLRKALEEAGFVLRRGVEELIEHHRILPMEHAESGMQLDVVRSRLTELGALIDDSSLIATFDALVAQANARQGGPEASTADPPPQIAVRRRRGARSGRSS
jgi:hypothetical protein